MVTFLIKERISEKGLSVSDFAKMCGFSVTSAYKYLNMQNISLDVLCTIAEKLECPVKSLFLEAGEEKDDVMFMWDDNRARMMRVVERALKSIGDEILECAETIDKVIEDSELKS